MTSMTSRERSLLESLDRALRSKAARASIDALVQRTKLRLASDPVATMGWETVPLDAYGEALPAQIQSSWVFILRAGASTGAERHPNSHQRMMSYQGSGDLQTGGTGQWRSHRLVSDAGASLEERWVSVPPNLWHQAVVPNQDWVVVSFHTAPAHELVEERPDSTAATQVVRRKYVSAAK